MSAQGFTDQGSIKPDNLFAGEFPSVQRVETITGGTVLVRGSVLGRITSSRHYTLSQHKATDGSQTPVVILAEDCDATTTDVKAVVYHAGEFNANALTYGEGHNATSVWSSWRKNGNNALFLRNNQGA